MFCLADPGPGPVDDDDDDDGDDDADNADENSEDGDDDDKNIALALNGLSDVCGQNIALDIVLLCSNCIAMVTARWW